MTASKETQPKALRLLIKYRYRTHILSKSGPDHSEVQTSRESVREGIDFSGQQSLGITVEPDNAPYKGAATANT